jgi:uncharacterized protein with von Willebrand factor type A (vWA) domain
MSRHSSRYSRYTGGPDPLAPPVDLREALEQIGQDVMEGVAAAGPVRGCCAAACRTCAAPTGWPPRPTASPGTVARNNLDGTLQEIKKLLDEAVLAERKELAPRRRRPVRRDCSWSRCRRRRPRPCRNCPSTTGAAAEARQKYDQIKDLMGREMLDQRFAGMKQALENATDEDRQPSTRCSTT